MLDYRVYESVSSSRSSPKPHGSTGGHRSNFSPFLAIPGVMHQRLSPPKRSEEGKIPGRYMMYLLTWSLPRSYVIEIFGFCG